MILEKDLNKRKDRSEEKAFRSVDWCILFVGSSPENGGDGGSSDGSGPPAIS